MKNLFVVAILFILVIGCDKYPEIDPDPSKAILGKWVFVAMGNGSNLEPLKNGSYNEYKSDSTLLMYSDLYPGELYVMNYWFDTLYHESKWAVDGNDSSLLRIDYKYEFYEDKLRIEFVDLYAWYTTFVLKRIN